MLSIVVSWRDRRELSRALPSMGECVRLIGGDLTVVNFGGSQPALAAELAGAALPIRLVTVPDQPYFNKSAAHNLGIASTPHPYLFFCDCDIVLDPDQLASLFRRVRDEPGTFGTLAGVVESERNARGAGHVTCFGYELLIKTRDGRSLRIVDNEEDAEQGTRQAPGLLCARRADLLRVGGYNGRLLGWGWEDQDMISRLTLGAGLRRVIAGRALHLSHDDHARVAHYPLANRWESRDKMFRQALANYDAGDFQGTYEHDVRAIARSVTE